MRTYLISLLFAAFFITISQPSLVLAQGTGIRGTVPHSKGGVLPGARIEIGAGLNKFAAVSDSQGRFVLSGVAPGAYKYTVSYVGFAPVTDRIMLVAGQVAIVSPVLQVASESEEVLVTARRVRGEAEAINEERNTSNILDVLPADVIASLPNANITDATDLQLALCLGSCIFLPLV